MPEIRKELEQILTNELFCGLVNSDKVQIAQLNAVIALLIKFNIPFSLTFSQATREDEATATLSIILNPTTQIQFTITFDC